MKYIKTYENYPNAKYWLIPSIIPEYEVALDKLPMPNNLKEHWKSRPFNFNTRKFYIYTNDVEWRWFNTDSEFLQQHLDFYGYKDAKFMGEIIVTPEDIEEYHINKKATKYNL